MNCYLCKSTNFTIRKGVVRDAPDIKILECDSCGLVSLSKTKSIVENFYENSGMHGSDVTPMDVWLKDTERDDLRRFEMIKTGLPNKRLLDFGCGAAGFLNLAQRLASEVNGVELEARARDFWYGRINILSSLKYVDGEYDFITAFHVVEHLNDPRAILSELASKLKPNGRIIIEVPSSEDVLLTLYDCDAFQRFTYWSQHLFLFNSNNLEKLSRQAGLKVVALEHYQRYTLSNHLYWLSRGKPGGHESWSFLSTPELENSYSNVLGRLGKTDTLIAYLELRD